MKKILLFFVCLLFSYVKPNIRVTQTGDIDLIRSCIEIGNFDIYEIEENGLNSINWAVSVVRLDILKLILESFEDNIIEVINVTDFIDNTPLVNALVSKSLDIVFLLLLYGADENFKNRREKTANDIAIEKGIIMEGDCLFDFLNERFGDSYHLLLSRVQSIK